MADSRQQTADSRQQTADSRQQTADSRQQTADSTPFEFGRAQHALGDDQREESHTRSQPGGGEPMLESNGHGVRE
jgi:hypothetical protein